MSKLNWMAIALMAILVLAFGCKTAQVQAPVQRQAQPTATQSTPPASQPAQAAQTPAPAQPSQNAPVTNQSTEQTPTTDAVSQIGQQLSNANSINDSGVDDVLDGLSQIDW